MAALFLRITFQSASELIAAPQIYGNCLPAAETKVWSANARIAK